MKINLFLIMIIILICVGLIFGYNSNNERAEFCEYFNYQYDGVTNPKACYEIKDGKVIIYPFETINGKRYLVHE